VDTSGGRRIGGWLLVLCLLLIVWQPLNLAAAVTSMLPAIAIRGPSALAALVARVAVSGLSVAAGIALFGGRPAAIPLARVSLTASAAMDVVLILTPYFPNNRVPGDEPLYVAAALAYYGVWMAYLARSRRVRAFNA
jgi:hypothetical protein